MPEMTRDQKRAKGAYDCVRAVPSDQRADYKVFVNDLGANILRSGLAVAIARLEHEASWAKPQNQLKPRESAARRLLGDLGNAEVPGLQPGGQALGDRVRELDVGAYMLASREMLKVATWFKRAVQALMPDDRGGVHGSEQ